MSEKTRPTKKQYELLDYIKEFTAEHGYSPSYREIMEGCNYNSVATVALHVRNLISRGHLVKRGRSARSLEVVSGEVVAITSANPKSNVESHEKWLVQTISRKFDAYEKQPSAEAKDELYVLVGVLKVFGMMDAMRSFIPRLPRD